MLPHRLRFRIKLDVADQENSLRLCAFAPLRQFFVVHFQRKAQGREGAMNLSIGDINTLLARSCESMLLVAAMPRWEIRAIRGSKVLRAARRI